MLPLEEVLEVVPTPGRYALIAFAVLAATVAVIYYFMKKSLKTTKKYFEENS